MLAVKKPRNPSSDKAGPGLNLFFSNFFPFPDPDRMPRERGVPFVLSAKFLALPVLAALFLASPSRAQVWPEDLR